VGASACVLTSPAADEPVAPPPKKHKSMMAARKEACMKKQSKGEDAVAEAITTTTADGVQAPKRHAWRDEVNEYFSLPNERGTCALRHAARPRFPLGAATASPVTKHSHHTSHPTHAPLRTRPPTEDDDFDLRAWWKKMSENDEETLWSLIARVYHGIDATSCQAERNFSLLAPLSAHRGLHVRQDERGALADGAYVARGGG